MKSYVKNNPLARDLPRRFRFNGVIAKALYPLLLSVSRKFRLYLHPYQGAGRSCQLHYCSSSVLLVVGPSFSPEKAWLLIALCFREVTPETVRFPSNSPSCSFSFSTDGGYRFNLFGQFPSHNFLFKSVGLRVVTALYIRNVSSVSTTEVVNSNIMLSQKFFIFCFFAFLQRSDYIFGL